MVSNYDYERTKVNDEHSGGEPTLGGAVSRRSAAVRKGYVVIGGTQEGGRAHYANRRASSCFQVF